MTLLPKRTWTAFLCSVKCLNTISILCAGSSAGNRASLGRFPAREKNCPCENLEEHPDGTLHISGDFESLDITDIPQNIKPQIFMGIKTSVEYYMPHYTPYDILLIANDRTPKPTEDSIIIYGNNVFIARRIPCGKWKI